MRMASHFHLCALTIILFCLVRGEDLFGSGSASALGCYLNLTCISNKCAHSINEGLTSAMMLTCNM